ncbi:hypothetical protein [Nocardia cyriacigeorgica]|uniref:hypothetical protein n=1 Tax=Nocardia cyriacigeorgica TaxID=135487 RepID=UPI001E306D9E|nr:hypothetical protein [Nocardia cyriacigeorgica]
MPEVRNSSSHFWGELALFAQRALQRPDGFVPGVIAGEWAQSFDFFGRQVLYELTPDLPAVLQSAGPISRALLGIEQRRRRLGRAGRAAQVRVQSVDALLDRLTVGAGGTVSRLDSMEQM